MEELTAMLNNIRDSYYDFVSAMIHYAEKKESRKKALINFLNTHPDANSSDVVLFVSEQPDFAEDAAYLKTA